MHCSNVDADTGYVDIFREFPQSLLENSEFCLDKITAAYVLIFNSLLIHPSIHPTLCDVRQSSLVHVYRRFEGNICLHRS